MKYYDKIMLLAHFIFLTVQGPAAQHLSLLKVLLFFFFQ